ncbi:MAG: fibronectin type III domain-containing protein [Candidatus Tectomicrobia bacterium]|uniref:Fibronectin type III domain-containing protein n=1 Tax=Tectimicrobiota bacterium TaxID=2528274 RepID=A0A933GLD0_UNCTE|nr:fibronectin type III domain-containing protein [Candidatus Tectomicrobia bacterium]
MSQCRGICPKISSRFSGSRSLTPFILSLFFTILISQLTLAAEIKLAWVPDTISDLSGYKIYYGTAPRVYGAALDVGNVTSYTLIGLSPGQVYYVAATAYDSYGNESDYSNEVSGVATEPTRTVVINVATSPLDLALIVDGVAVTSPQTFNWEVGSSHTLSVASPQSGDSGVNFIYSSWSDGGALSHQITIPDTTATYTANFVVPGTLTVASHAALISSGPLEGPIFKFLGRVSYPHARSVPFSPASATYTLKNTGQTTITWSASKTQNWVSLSSPGGALEPGAGTAVRVWVNSNASNLKVGSHSDTVTFINTTNGNGNTSRSIELKVNLPYQNYTVTTSPRGLSLLVDGVTVSSPRTFSWQVGSSHTLSVISPQIETSGSRQIYSSWSDGGTQSHRITVPSTSTTYTANFITQYSLTISTSPLGAGWATPFGSNWYHRGQKVSLYARSSPMYTFSGWSGSLSDKRNPILITMNSPQKVLANFGPTNFNRPNRLGAPKSADVVNVVKVGFNPNGNSPLSGAESLKTIQPVGASPRQALPAHEYNRQGSIDPLTGVFRSFYLGINEGVPYSYSSSGGKMPGLDNLKGVSLDGEIATLAETDLFGIPDEVEIGLALNVAEEMNSSMLKGLFTVILFAPDGITGNFQDPVIQVYEFDFTDLGGVSIKQLPNLQDGPEDGITKSYSLEPDGSLTIGELSGQVKRDGEMIVLMNVSPSGAARPHIFIGVKQSGGHTLESLKGEYVDVTLTIKNVGKTKEWTVTEGVVRFDGAGDCDWTILSGLKGPQNIMPGIYSVSADGAVRAFGTDGLISADGEFIVLPIVDNAVTTTRANSGLRILMKRE